MDSSTLYMKRVMEEPFPEFVFQTTRKVVVSESSSTSSDSLSLDNFSLGSGLGDLSDPGEVDFDLQNLFVVQRINVGNGDECGRRNSEVVEGTCDCTSQPLIRENISKSVSVEAGTVPPSEASSLE